ncbi:MAG: phosphoribosylformylglycinamidine synthase, partial [Oscillospiraceae bacterium]|nr:phosphoribosylformylglycinamidine synthase [Oscillospiraceae bacterium]
MVYRVFVEKKPGLAPEAAGLLNDCKNFLGLSSLENVRILNRYDVSGIDADLFDYSRGTVFSEPQLDNVYAEADLSDANAVFAVEPLPGQFDQRADSAAQCIQLLSQGERPTVRSAKVYALYGALTEQDINAVKAYVINAVESREASLEKPETLDVEYAIPQSVATVEGFIALDDAGLSELLNKLGLAMDIDDLRFLQAYFRDDEKRDPTITEIRVVDTYWSDHCRHTTFSTHIDEVEITDPEVKAAYERYLAAR